MRLGTDRAVAHGAGREALDDLAGRLDLVQRHGLAHPLLEGEQAAQGRESFRLVVDQGRVLLEDVVPGRPGGVLQLEHGPGVEQVVLALATPLVLATDPQVAVGGLGRVGQVGEAMAFGHLGGDLGQPDPLDVGGRAGEVRVDQLVRQAHGLEHLGPGVGGNRRDAHLGHDLEDALGQTLDVVGGRVLGRDARDHLVADQVVDGLEGQVRVDRAGAVADQAGHVVHLAGVTRLHHQPHLGPGLDAHEVVVHGRGQQQRRDRRHLGVRVAVGQDDDSRPVVDRGGDLLEDALQRRGQAVTTLGHGVQAVDRHGGEVGVLAVLVHVEDLRQLLVGEDGARQHDLATRAGLGVQHVALRTDARGHRRHELLADGVQRRVGHLREQLLEVVEQQSRPLREHRGRRVRAHRADGLGPGARHGREHDLELFGGVAEGALELHDGGVLGQQHLAGREVAQVQLARGKPVAVGLGSGERVLDLLVGDDATL